MLGRDAGVDDHGICGAGVVEGEIDGSVYTEIAFENAIFFACNSACPITPFFFSSVFCF
ncbi:hypothetical protein [Thermoactinomyces sp. CICC 10523]|uniref:hypothetical protein n=1 Tax=Thermoactinomyces sp. CICC 10523 TaxID=2767428 RepID=UPI0018DB10E2|nr:hypothetical protein [Thermoactinomyces sp. CICC 10523]MBH8598213.1 hypothetical protein [Thermoactinomyces sp. CICC 10523]